MSVDHQPAPYVADNRARFDKPWRRPGALRYAIRRLAGMINPPVTVTESRTQ